MCLDEWEVLPSYIPNIGSMDLIIKTNEMFLRKLGGIFLPPESRPKFHWVLEPVPPNFLSHDIVEISWISETQSSQGSWSANFFPTDKGRFLPLFMTVPEKIPLKVSNDFDDSLWCY